MTAKPVQQYEDVTDKPDDRDVVATVRELFGVEPGVDRAALAEGERCGIAPLPPKSANGELHWCVPADTIIGTSLCRPPARR